MRIPLATIVVALSLTTAAPARAQVYSENYVSAFAGLWFGADFASRSLTVFDSVSGNIDYTSSLLQGEEVVLGLQYTGFFNEFFAADVAVGFGYIPWVTESGRVEFGQFIGQSDTLHRVLTIPMALNGLLRVPLGDGLPKPFVTGGLGAVLYEFGRTEAPLIIPPTLGTPIDTLLFDLKLGLRVAPNVGGGVMYSLSDRWGVRAEARYWFTLLEEVIESERIVQQNKWFLLSATFRL